MTATPSWAALWTAYKAAETEYQRATERVRAGELFSQQQWADVLAARAKRDAAQIAYRQAHDQFIAIQRDES